MLSPAFYEALFSPGLAPSHSQVSSPCLTASSSTPFHLRNVDAPGALSLVLCLPFENIVHQWIFLLSHLYPLSLSQKLKSPSLLSFSRSNSQSQIAGRAFLFYTFTLGSNWTCLNSTHYPSFTVCPSKIPLTSVNNAQTTWLGNPGPNIPFCQIDIPK